VSEIIEPSDAADMEILVQGTRKGQKTQLRLWLRMLSIRTMVTNGNITGLADRLEADGLIQREALDGDRRVTVAKLTRKGRETFAVMAKTHEGWLRELMGDVDDSTLDEALSLLAQVKASASRRLAASED